MAMVDLASQKCASEDCIRPVCLSDIADRQEISLSYLEQLFAKLKKSGLIESARGPGGGYRLAHPASEIRISDIINAVDEPIRATRCAPTAAHGCMNRKTRCKTHDLWEELGNQIHLFLKSVTLEDVVEDRVLGRSGLLHCGLSSTSDAVRA